MIRTRRRGRLLPTLAGLALTATLVTACGDGGDEESVAIPPVAAAPAAAPSGFQEEAALYATMHDLWSDHMQYTIGTVDAFFHEKKALQARLDRLLANQEDIGAAIGSYFGQEVGDEVTDAADHAHQGGGPGTQGRKGRRQGRAG